MKNSTQLKNEIKEMTDILHLFNQPDYNLQFLKRVSKGYNQGFTLERICYDMGFCLDTEFLYFLTRLKNNLRGFK